MLAMRMRCVIMHFAYTHLLTLARHVRRSRAGVGAAIAVEQLLGIDFGINLGGR